MSAWREQCGASIITHGELALAGELGVRQGRISGGTTILMTDPFARWRGTTLWRALDDALSRAEADGVLQCAADGGREAAIGHLCMQLDAEGLATGTRLAAVRLELQHAGWREEDYRDNLALELCALLDRGAAVEAVAEYIGRFETELSTRPSSALSERLALAAGVRQAYEQAGESDAPPA